MRFWVNTFLKNNESAQKLSQAAYVMVAPPSELMRSIFREIFLIRQCWRMTKISREKAQKCVHRQQIEWWHHLANLSELFITQTFRWDNVEKEWEIQSENPQKFTHKLNKQQLKWWCQPANLFELFLPKSFYVDSVTEGWKFWGQK